MASQFDESDFVDGDFENLKTQGRSAATMAASSSAARPPNREELDLKVNHAHQQLAELKRAQDELQRERAALEEARRRRLEWETGREEILQSVTRGVELLAESEFAARRESEQMSKTLSGLRESLQKIQSIQEETWTQENWNMELTRALTSVENARMEWNSARLKWPFLDGALTDGMTDAKETAPGLSFPGGRGFVELCKLGLALTWPVALVALIGFGVITFILLR